MTDYYDDEVGQPQINVSASTRKFQQSIIVKQDLNKSGILYFVKSLDKGSSEQTNGEGGY